MYGSSLDCNGLQPIQHLLKSLSRESTDLQYCDWLRSRRNDVIHSEQGLYLYEAHGARQIPENNLKVRYYILALKTFIKRQESYIGYILHWTCWQDDSSSNYKWMLGMGFMSPLVEENKHRYVMQRLSREYWQQLDTGWRYLSNVDRVHHELWKHKDRVKQFHPSMLNTVNTWGRLSKNIQWQKNSLWSNLAI